MNSHFYGENWKPEEHVDEPKNEVEEPVVKTDAMADRISVDPAQIHETAMGGTVAAVSPMNGLEGEPVQFLETPEQEIPMGGTMAAVGPMDKPVADEIKQAETLPQANPIVEEVDTVTEKVVTQEPTVETFVSRNPTEGSIADEPKERPLFF